VGKLSNGTIWSHFFIHPVGLNRSQCGWPKVTRLTGSNPNSFLNSALFCRSFKTNPHINVQTESDQVQADDMLLTALLRRQSLVVRRALELLPSSLSTAPDAGGTTGRASLITHTHRWQQRVIINCYLNNSIKTVSLFNHVKPPLCYKILNKSTSNLLSGLPLSRQCEIPRQFPYGSQYSCPC